MFLLINDGRIWMTEGDGMLAGELYNPLDPNLVIVLDVCEVRIGDYSLFGPGVQILTPVHRFNAALRREQESGKPVEIGADVWVGGGAVILAGVQVGSRAVIGAGSVITRDIPSVSLRQVILVVSFGMLWIRTPLLLRAGAQACR